MALRLGEILVQRGVLTREQRDELLERQSITGRPLGVLAETIHGVCPSDIEQAWAEQFAALADHVDPVRAAVPPEVRKLIDRRQAWQFKVLPLDRRGGELVVCTSRRHLARALRFAGWRLGESCTFVIADPDRLGHALMRFYPMDGMDERCVVADPLAAVGL